MNCTIAYFTARKEPRFAWFCDSLCRQMPSDQLAQVQVVFVDAQLWAIGTEVANRYFRRAGKFPLGDKNYHNWERREEVEAAVCGRFDYLHIPPKPSRWQGPFRYTKRDFFAASNARNTAIIVADRPYLVCVDDLTVLAAGWVDNVRHAVHHGYVACGAYRKVLQMEVDNGALLSFKENMKDGIDVGRDTRWIHGNDTGIVPWTGKGLYGCSFGVPVSLAVKVDGLDSSYDGQGHEDYDFGVRLERAGGKFFYNRNMLTYESEEGHFGAWLPREKALVPLARLPEYLRTDHDKVLASHPDAGAKDGIYSDHVLLHRLLREEARTLPLMRETPHNIVDLRDQWQREKLVPILEHCPEDWRTGQPLSTLDEELVVDL